jgi:hypothetical protein
MPEAMDMASLRKGVDEIDLVDTLEYEDQVTQIYAAFELPSVEDAKAAIIEVLVRKTRRAAESGFPAWPKPTSLRWWASKTELPSTALVGPRHMGNLGLNGCKSNLASSERVGAHPQRSFSMALRPVFDTVLPRT